jgi:hypothetical protein
MNSNLHQAVMTTNFSSGLFITILTQLVNSILIWQL